MKMIGIDALKTGLSYVRRNPSFLVRAAANTARLKLGVPVTALGWLATKMAKGRAPKDLEIRAVPPALGVSATVSVMGTELLISAAVISQTIEINEEQLLLSVRVRDLAIKAPPQSPIAQMLLAMDLGKPGNLMAFMPMKLPALIEAHDDLFVFDLLRLPKLRENRPLRRVLAALSQVISIKDLKTEEDLLVLSLRAHPAGLSAALASLSG
jgi:hypothetical protein